MDSDFARPENLLGHSFPNVKLVELEPKDERLLQQSAKIGYLTGRNSVLETELYKKNQTIKEQSRIIDNLTAENKQKTELYNDMYQERNEWRTKAQKKGK